MSSKRTAFLDERIGDYEILLEAIENEPRLHDYGISRQAWLRGVKLMRHFGPERALDLIDRRAERAIDRRDYQTARRWRDLMTAIHAVQEDVRLFGEGTH